MQPSPKPITNKVRNRFLALPESVSKCLEPEPKLSDFQTLQELGVGSFGRVFLVMHKITKAQYAIKAIDKRNKNNIEGKPYFRREIEIMYKIHHPNVVRLFGHFEDNQNCYFIMEYVNQGNLCTLMEKQTNKCLEPQIVAGLLKDLIRAVYFLHQMDPPIIHRDIKPENALLAEGLVLKLTDFGWSNYIDDSGDIRNTFCGTPIYLAPEMIRGTGHDEHIDIWCIGCLMYELLTGSPPFSGPNKEGLMLNILHMKINYPKNMNADAKDLLQKILLQDPNQRISLVDMLKHPFFTKYFPNAVNELTKPNHNDIPPYVISKDTPQSVLKKKERKLIKRNRGNSPHPVSRLHLEKLKELKQTNNDMANDATLNQNATTMKDNVICNSNDAILTAEKEILIVEKEQIQKKYDDLLLSYSNIQSIHNESLKTIDSANDTIRKLQKDKEALLRDIDEKDSILEELKQSLDDERSNPIRRTKSGKKTTSSAVMSSSGSSSCYNNSNDKSQQLIFDLEETLNEKEAEIANLKHKIKQLGGNANEECDDDDGTDSVSEKECVQKELFVQKEKYETIIKELTKTQAQSEAEREKEKKRLLGLIKKYERMLDIQSTENKKLKEKKKELEITLTKLRLSNME